MSAYIVDPRTIDYLVQWGVFRGGDARARIPKGIEHSDLPRSFQGHDFYVILGRVEPSDLGQVLLNENVRSVGTRYPDDGPEDLPGPIDQRRVWKYQFQPVEHTMLRAEWVIKSCDCLDYQSCETEDWQSTLAYAVLQAIRESAIDALTEDAPWGVTDENLNLVRLA